MDAMILSLGQACHLKEVSVPVYRQPGSVAFARLKLTDDLPSLRLCKGVALSLLVCNGEFLFIGGTAIKCPSS